jgi:hypothetical protein
MQHVPIIGVMTIDAPPILFIMLKYDIIVEIFQFSPLKIGIHIGMTLRAGKYVLAERRGRELVVHLFVFDGLLRIFFRTGCLVACRK